MHADDPIEYTKQIYTNSDSAWPEHDAWHYHTVKFLDRTVDSLLATYATHESIILNAGSGGKVYRQPGIYYDCDLVDKFLIHSEHPIHANIENLPCVDGFFDIVICVGSVLNYVDAALAIREFSRVLKKNGMLILEFERSDSAEFLFTPHHHQNVFRYSYQYNGETHRLWMYSEKYISNIVRGSFSLLKTMRFQVISALAFRFSKSKNAGMLSSIDKFTQAFSYSLAHNAIILCRK
jgi:SAM-dependent methyltransferase